MLKVKEVFELAETVCLRMQPYRTRRICLYGRPPTCKKCLRTVKPGDTFRRLGMTEADHDAICRAAWWMAGESLRLNFVELTGDSAYRVSFF